MTVDCCERRLYWKNCRRFIPLAAWEHIFKKSVNVLAPFLCRLFCWSLEHNVIPFSMKSAYIVQILKKVDLDSSDLK